PCSVRYVPDIGGVLPVQQGGQRSDAKEDDQPIDIQSMTPAESRNEPGVEGIEKKGAERGPGADDAHGRAARADEPVADDRCGGHHDAGNASRYEHTECQVIVPERLSATGKRQAGCKKKSPGGDDNLRPEAIVEASGQR